MSQSEFDTTYSPQADFLLKFLLSLKYNMDVELKEQTEINIRQRQTKLSGLVNAGDPYDRLTGSSPWCCWHPHSSALGRRFWRRWK